MNLTTFSWPSLPKSFNNSISLSRAFLPFSPEMARKSYKNKINKQTLHVRRDTINYVVNIHFQKCCILGVKLSAQITMHLVCIRKIKFRFQSPIKSILAKKMLAVPFNCIEHEISKIDSSSLKKLYTKKEQLSLTRQAHRTAQSFTDNSQK